MTDTVLSPERLGADSPTIPRRRELLVGTAFATAGAAMMVVFLLANYLVARTSMGADWFANNQIPLTQPNMQLITLGMSVISMQWAVWSITRNDRYHTYMAMGVTILLGVAFVNQTTFLYKMAGVTIAQSEGPLFYAVTGSHLAMVIAAIIFMILVTFRTFAGQYSSRIPDGISAVAILWYAAVALYALIWFAVYVQK